MSSIPNTQTEMNPQAQPEPILDIQNLITEIRVPGRSLRPVEIERLVVPRGQVVGIVGESGSGKSMTAYSILNLFPTAAARVHSGSILLDGVDMVTARENERVRIRGDKVGMVFQDYAMSFNPVISIGKQLMEQLLTHGRHENAKAKVLSVLNEVGLSAEVFSRYPHELSGGMLQRVGIASALVCDPPLIVADEPTTALDVTVQAQILELLKRIQKERNLSILLITHDLGIVAEICDLVYVMYVGQIVEHGTVHKIFKSPAHPYTQGLLQGTSSVQSVGTHEIRVAIHGSIPGLTEIPSGCRFHDRCPYTMDICRTQEPGFYEVNGLQAACWLHDPEHSHG
jgi:oligopeptide/dipeptide ABC transporter ATP-binding protein